MTIDEWRSEFQKAVLAKIAAIDPSRELRILDVGVFPWHSYIELSAFYTGDDESADCWEDDIASWPGYNFSEQQEGQWPEVEPATQAMNAAYQADTQSKVQYFQAAASVMQAEAVRQALQSKSLASDFRIALADPDDPDTSYL